MTNFTHYFICIICLSRDSISQIQLIIKDKMESVISVDSSTELSDLITELHVSPHSTSSLESSNDETNFQNSNDSIDERGGINFEENVNFSCFHILYILPITSFFPFTIRNSI